LAAIAIQDNPPTSNTAHCERPGYPSCYNLGSEAGKISPGTSCPPGHSKAFCNAYEAASGTSAKNNNHLGSSSQKADAAHCDQPRWPSCYSLGLQAGKANTGSNCPSGHSAKYCVGWNAGAGNTTHCDQPGWPSCYTLGYQAGSNALGTTCPTGHRQAFCNGYQYGSGGNGRGYVQGVADPTYCDQPGLAVCYDVGYHDGYNNAINSITNSILHVHQDILLRFVRDMYQATTKESHITWVICRVSIMQIMIGTRVIRISMHLTTIVQVDI